MRKSFNLTLCTSDSNEIWSTAFPMSLVMHGDGCDSPAVGAGVGPGVGVGVDGADGSDAVVTVGAVSTVTSTPALARMAVAAAAVPIALERALLALEASVVLVAATIAVTTTLAAVTLHVTWLKATPAVEAMAADILDSFDAVKSDTSPDTEKVIVTVVADTDDVVCCWRMSWSAAP